MNYKMIIHTLGWILLFESAFMLVPAITALVYAEFHSLAAFLISAGACLAQARQILRDSPQWDEMIAFFVAKPTVLRARWHGKGCSPEDSASR